MRTKRTANTHTAPACREPKPKPGVQIVEVLGVATGFGAFQRVKISLPEVPAWGDEEPRA